MSDPRGLAAEPRGGRGGGVRHAAWWTLAVLGAALPLAVMTESDDAAAAQTSVAPVLSCGGGMVLDSASGTCLTQRTETALRPSSCPAGATRVGGEYGGHVCQTKVTTTVNTGRTRQVYSHTTYSKVWIPTGTETVQTGTNRAWVPPRTTVEPLVPPVRVRTGTSRRCDFDPVLGAQFNCRNVPVYGYRTSQTVTIPGYWSETPIYETRETGYWDRVPTIHYTTVPVYETVVEWVTSAVTPGPCPAGWRSAGSQCSRTVLGPPSAAPAQSCPSGTAPLYGDAFDGTGPSVLTCQLTAPSSEPDTANEQEDSGGSETSPDGARPLHHLAGESDERLAELGIHRCADGLLSYVPCDELPGRTWESDPGTCDGIDGTTYRPDHGGSCVTESDLLNKCTTPGDCSETTIRTYCPAIGELADTQIQEHAHPDRGAETYRVCIFDCSSFATLPPYVQSRINGSYDYACLPAPEEEPSPTTTSTTAPTTTTTTEPGEEDSDGDDDRDEDDDPGDPPDVDQRDTTEPDTTEPDSTEPDTNEPDTTEPPDDECASVPPTRAAAGALSGLTLVSHVRAASPGTSPQRHLPGGGRYLQVAPGRGWVEVGGSVEVSERECRWAATWVRASWEDLRPWEATDRQAMEASADTRHLVKRWDSLSADQQQLVKRWRPNAVRAGMACTVGDASGSGASTSCGWVLAHPAAYEWGAQMCFELKEGEGRSRFAPSRGRKPAATHPCWVSVASGVDWIRSVGDYADGRVTIAQSGSGS
ncbi:hypothetical protein [Candidatus Poriferisodalis sp.]|uniref:hypothetical protein n=1 Tax=Candidatus Poriferisodalis sp. TaxID=3101277 RepID=UPI003B018675